ncbi:MAG: inositol monophosphatase [Clostridiaceae bacterium]|nr:inositol monophosphatase [Clostridiaceae bacterium]
MVKNMGEYSEILKHAINIAHEAGNYVRDSRSAGIHVDAKSAIDFVSDKDKISENMIRKAIKTKYPGHMFFGEESVFGETPEEEEHHILSFSDDNFVWVVDPIDGTVNYIRGFPQYVVSIAVIHKRKIVVGVIYDPVHEETFYAEIGCGAYMNGVRIHVSERKRPDEMILNTSIPTNSLETREKMVRLLPIIANKYQALRVWNCAAMSLAYVAAGKLDADYEAGIHLWDMAAGIIIVREAGGVVTQIDGSEIKLTSDNILASNGLNHNDIVSSLTSF